MKRILAVLLCGLLLMGCSEDTKPVIIEDDSTFNLVADPNTGVIYIKNYTSGGYVYTPYFSKNGKLCKYGDREIVEIN